METKRLGAIETRFAELIWANAPLSSPELVRLCAEVLGWKKSTTYTVLKKSTQFVEENFSGSLPAFLAAFAAGKKLTPPEVDELQRMIDRYREEG